MKRPPLPAPLTLVERERRARLALAARFKRLREVRTPKPEAPPDPLPWWVEK